MSKMGWEGGGTRAALGGRRGEEEDNMGVVSGGMPFL